MQIKVKKLFPNAIIPTAGTEGAAGYDLYATSIKNEDGVWIYPGNTERVGTGIAVEIPKGYVGLVFGRSGMAIKRGLRLSNAIAKIDSDFRGEIVIGIYNDSYKPQDIRNGDRIAQLIVVPCHSLEFEEVNELSQTKRGSNGLGWTGR